MRSRADKLVQIAEEARDRARLVEAKAIAARDHAARELAACRDGLEAARKERVTLLAAGAHEASYHELDAWVRSHEGRVARAQSALLGAEQARAAAKVVTDKASMRVEQFCALRERARAALRLEEARAERRAEDEGLARRATTK